MNKFEFNINEIDSLITSVDSALCTFQEDLQTLKERKDAVETKGNGKVHTKEYTEYNNILNRYSTQITLFEEIKNGLNEFLTQINETVGLTERCFLFEDDVVNPALSKISNIIENFETTNNVTKDSKTFSVWEKELIIRINAAPKKNARKRVVHNINRGILTELNVLLSTNLIVIESLIEKINNNYQLHFSPLEGTELVDSIISLMKLSSNMNASTFDTTIYKNGCLPKDGLFSEEYYTLENPSYGHTPKLDVLPKELQKFINDNLNISLEDFIITDDGALICKEGILSFLDIDKLPFKFSTTNLNSFNDWKLYAIQDENDDWHYSIYKLRAGAFANSFVEINKDWLNRLNSAASIEEFSTIFNEIAIAKNMEGSKTLTDYFSNNSLDSSQASYVFADLYVEDFISEYSIESNTKVQLQTLPIDGINYSPQQIYDELLSENDKALLDQYNCFDYKTGTINISNPISTAEYNSILIMNTGNSSSYSLAAEIKYHSDHAELPDLPPLPITNFIINQAINWGGNQAINWVENQGIVTNAGIGEETESGFTDSYLNELGVEIHEQQENHKPIN